jgi:hypothetical protein
LRYEVRKNANRIRFVYHQDEQLSTAFITNEKREIQNHYQYDAFGNGICQEEGISNRIRYTVQRQNARFWHFVCIRRRTVTPLSFMVVP